MAKTNDFVKEAAKSIYAVSADEAIRLQCEARERYERDWAESYSSGKEDGREEDIINLMKNLKMTEQQAMDAIGIPASERSKYRANLQKRGVCEE